MTNNLDAWEPPDWMSAFDELPAGSLNPGDYLFALDDLDFDPRIQLGAIRTLLQRNRDADEALEAEIHASAEHATKVRGILNDYAVDHWVDLVHYSVYQDATHSLAAVGMIAPFLETVFSQCFFAIGRQFFQGGPMPSAHRRWKGSPARIWDCRYYISRNDRFNEGRVEGIIQLADASGLLAHLPADIQTTMTALFEYRNKMFHHGLEWPADVRQKFQERIGTAGWPTDWFSIATSADRPWVFYMSQRFIDQCLDTSEKTLEGFSQFIEARLLPLYYAKARQTPDPSQQ